ncbi:STAS domain-containing protein [Amycolatopsis sp. NPDC058278]|uniref:STAS domain-containing protein n=1 Tax=Amycolatopsis sp. NPDC058278 TaxID=3346417 RepID=UPI0036DAE181
MEEVTLVSSTFIPRSRGPRHRAAASFGVTRTAVASVVTASGELDLTVTDLLAALLAYEVRLYPPALVCDTSAVEFCTAGVLTVLIDSVADAARAGVPFAVAGRRRALLRPVTALGLEQALPLHRSVAEALKRLTLSPHLTDTDARGNRRR